MRLFANITSILFHPLLMATYGMLLAVTYTYLAIYPDYTKMFLVGGVFVSTAFIPGLFILLLVKSGSAKDLELTDRHDRLVPYLIFIISNIACLFYLNKLQAPIWLWIMFAGVCVALCLSLIINFYWKISAHGLGIGGLLGGVMGVSQLHALNPYWLFILVLVAAGLIGSSRVILQKHTPGQVYAGFLLGFLCVFCPSLWTYYKLVFI